MIAVHHLSYTRVIPLDACLAIPCPEQAYAGINMNTHAPKEFRWQNIVVNANSTCMLPLTNL
uniref:Uncharacterized protein n=1 Tax=viral metagenome TaxID=1070528 RepID=A0A6C0BZJ1_9ZZZZ